MVLPSHIWLRLEAEDRDDDALMFMAAFFHSSQETEATWMSRDGWMHNKDVACDNNRILLSLGIWKWLAAHWESVLLNATTRMESEDILLREASRGKMRTTWFHLHAERKEAELRNREVVARCWGWLSVDVEF